MGSPTQRGNHETFLNFVESFSWKMSQEKRAEFF